MKGEKHIKNLENKSHIANFADPDFFVCIDLAFDISVFSSIHSSVSPVHY